MSANNMSPKDAYQLILRDYPYVMNIEQMCEILAGDTPLRVIPISTLSTRLRWDMRL